MLSVPARIKSEHAQKVCQLLTTFEQRRRRQFVQRNGGGNSAKIIKQPLTQRIVQFAENKVVGFIDTNLTRAFAEVPRPEILPPFGRAKSLLRHRAIAATTRPSKQSARPRCRQDL